MSYRSEPFLKYKPGTEGEGTGYLEAVGGSDLQSLFLEILQNGMHGICFSLYEEGQKPGDIIGEAQIRRRLSILKPHISWVRTFSCTEGNELIPVIAKEMGIKTLVGAWLGKDKKKNETELQNLISLNRAGVVDIAAVGNEVLYRKDLTEAELLAYIKNTREQMGTTPVGYVDAYYEFVRRPSIADACDVILCNCYPFWEKTPFEYAFGHMRQMYRQAREAGKGKPILITETGWPSQGEPCGAAIPTEENALKYFINTQLWAQDDNVKIFYFSSFDESWKKSDEGEVGAYWGLWDSRENLKYVHAAVPQP
jgi:exo-beta-1,3-glucanase (GH17 family)